MDDTLDAVKTYHSYGWQPVAAPLKGKSPRGQWKRFQKERATERDLEEGFARPANVFLITGAISRLVVLDCDNEAAVKYWDAKLGGILDETTAVKTGREGTGFHFYFRLPEGKVVKNSTVDGDEGEPSWSIRGEGGGVIAPPSIHSSGTRYEWTRGPQFIQEAPRAILEMSADSGPEGGTARSILTHLLQNPPSGEGSRNDWLTRVAGHYAKHIPHEDAFAQMVWDAAAKLSPPLEEEEVQKLIDSVWNTEQAKEGRAVLEHDGETDGWRSNLRRPTEENGYLVSGGYHILVQTRQKKGDEIVYGLGPWLDCDIRVLGIIETEYDRQFSIELRFPDGRLIEDHVSSATLSDHREMNKWLARHGASIGPPDTIWPVRYSPSTRMMRYLGSQEAQPMEAAEALGWHRNSEAFITHEGVIRKQGPAPFEHVRPDPNLKKWAPYRYGQGGNEEARAILAEVLTFHDEVVASVFGAWWAAVLLKPQIQERSSQFPFMAIEAPSESGKTKGFFPLMMQLAGNASGNIQPTRASLRDYLSAHNNGIVWMDDLDSLESYGEILRNVTVGGSMVKKGQDNASQVVATMRSALVISGESLGLRDQKALVDRAIALDVSSPMSRRSLRDSDRPQWDDIIDLTNRHPDLTDYSGSIIQMALGQAEAVKDLKKLRDGSGRHADAMAILRVGARILRGMLGASAVGLVERVDEWVKEQTTQYTGRENALTLKLLPMALANTGWLARPEPPLDTHRKVATPVFVEEELIVWFSPRLLSEWWVREPKANRKVSERTESEKALTDQAKELGLGGKKGIGRKDFKLVGTQKTMRYWRCPPELSETLMQRSRGIENAEEEGEVGEQIELDDR